MPTGSDEHDGWSLFAKENGAFVSGSALCFNDTAMETFWATLKTEVRHIWGPTNQRTRSEMRTTLFDYVETFSNRTHHQAALRHRPRGPRHRHDRQNQRNPVSTRSGQLGPHWLVTLHQHLRLVATLPL